MTSHEDYEVPKNLWDMSLDETFNLIMNAAKRAEVKVQADIDSKGRLLYSKFIEDKQDGKKDFHIYYGHCMPSTWFARNPTARTHKELKTRIEKLELTVKEMKVRYKEEEGYLKVKEFKKCSKDGTLSLQMKPIGNPVYGKEPFAPTHVAKVENDASVGDKRLKEEDENDIARKVKKN